MSDKTRIQFSLTWLLGVTTAVAVTIMVARQLSGTFAIMAALIVIPSFLVYVVLKIAAIAIEKQKLLHFWQATFAYAFLLPSVTLPVMRFKNHDPFEAIVFAIIFGIGFMLALAALYRGNNATRIYALPVVLAYLSIAYQLLSSAIIDWSSVRDYWFQ